MKFEDYDSLAAWEASEARHTLVAELDELVREVTPESLLVVSPSR